MSEPSRTIQYGGKTSPLSVDKREYEIGVRLPDYSL